MGLLPGKVRVRLTDDPEPSVTIGGVDVTAAVESFSFTVTAERAVARLVVQADADIDFPAEVDVSEGRVPDWLSSVTAGDLEQAVVSGDYATPVGEKVLAYLKARAAGE